MAYTEQQTIAALRKLAKNWPKGYTLFSWSGTLCLLRDDLLPHAPELERRTMNGHTTYGGSYRDAVIEDFPGIVNDGGDPD